jgi:hypothetical protein
MELTADLAFGVEAVTVAGVSKALDVCGLADELYDAMNAVPAETDPFKETKLSGIAAAAVFKARGVPGHRGPGGGVQVRGPGVHEGARPKKRGRRRLAYRRRANVAERFPGLDALRLSATDLAIYDDLIRFRDAEAIMASPHASPEQVEAAAMVTTGNRLAAQVAAAKARLRQSAQAKGF